MAKDPAFLFYPNDYIGGTMGMTFEEKGAYMELLMMQFNRGHMTSHMIGQTVGQLWDKLQDKFIKDEKGLWYNKRLDEEKEKRKRFTASRKNNLKGVNQYTKKDPLESGHMTSHMENENVNKDINKDNINNNGFFENLLNSESWLEQVAMKHKCKVSFIKTKLGEFNNDLFLRADQKQNQNEYQSHFVNWLSKNKSVIKSKYTAHDSNVF